MNRRIPIRYIFDRMRKNVFLLIVLVNSLALVGLFATQVFWIRKQYGLLEEQFNNNARIALKGVANQLLISEILDHPLDTVSQSSSSAPGLPDVNNIGNKQLSSLIDKEFSDMNIGSNYEYAIINQKTGDLLAGDYGHYSNRLRDSECQVNLVGYRDSDHYSLAAYFPEQSHLIVKKLLNWIIISIIFALVLIIGFPVSIFIFNRQKKLSAMKSDFINNMTHEFKTPIATISLASEMLLKKNVQEDHDKMQRYARIIFDENTRLQHHVEQILSVSRLERGHFKLKIKEVDVNQLIQEIVKNFELTIRERDGVIRTHFCATRYIIPADRAHLTNVINNLLDNANKYSPEKPWIRIGTQSSANGLTITVEDRGVGISVENQQQIFQNFYRVPTGNIYNVKGFGIGLYYVKTIVEAHGGHINLKSELNKGSRFDIYLPSVQKSSQKNDDDQT